MVDWLSALVAPLNAVLVTMWGDPVSWAELLGFVTGLFCVALTVRRSVANFPFGIANAALFLVLFASARLWADSALQSIYIALGFVGWWRWHFARSGRKALVVKHARRAELGWCMSFVVGVVVVLCPVLSASHDSAPFFDALTTGLSLVAQWLLNGKRIESWYFWIAADFIYVPLYLSRGLNLTAIVYILFLALCVAGLRDWTRNGAVDQQRPNSRNMIQR